MSREGLNIKKTNFGMKMGLNPKNPKQVSKNDFECLQNDRNK